ncbi:aldo/keto reductase [Niveibacterium sp. 24ML]|uniref:aldo/keto reductase n=1 Tax=Niveibacterium sp. 24ML TaxID=2985512 RepID=UPI0022708F0B|nr:aldo/keto reductase [Niveibacterium sp. 24ML]MCX9158416.1 aldo/keto reductase [Niveibacterium sp. 24ML]
MTCPRIQLTDCGPQLSRVVAGAWRMDSWNWSPQQRLDWIRGCIELGVTSFDHADIYGGYTVEGLFGEALALEPALRQRIELVTKTGIALTTPARPAHWIKHYNTRAAHIEASVENSLRALRTDWIDLLLIHRPSPLMDPDEIAGAFERLRSAGKVRHFGVSNFTPSQFAMLNARTPLVTNQIELSPLHREPLHDGRLDQATTLRTPPMIWSALGGGRLFGDAPEAQRTRAALEAVANTRGVSLETVVYAWIMRHPSGPLPLTGSQRLPAIAAAVAATRLELDEQEWFSIWQAAAGHEAP